MSVSTDVHGREKEIGREVDQPPGESRPGFESGVGLHNTTVRTGRSGVPFPSTKATPTWLHVGEACSSLGVCGPFPLWRRRGAKRSALLLFFPTP